MSILEDNVTPLTSDDFKNRLKVNDSKTIPEEAKLFSKQPSMEQTVSNLVEGSEVARVTSPKKSLLGQGKITELAGLINGLGLKRIVEAIQAMSNRTTTNKDNVTYLDMVRMEKKREQASEEQERA